MTIRELITELTKLQEERGGHFEVCVYDGCDGSDLGTIEQVSFYEDNTCWLTI